MGFVQRAMLYLFFLVGIGIAALPSFMESTAHNQDEEEHVAFSDPVGDESFFHKISYFSHQKGRENLQLKALDLTVNKKTSKTVFFGPKGVAFTSSGKEVKYSAKRGEYITDKEYLELDGQVDLKMSHSHVKANRVDFYGKKDLIDCTGDVYSKSISKKSNDSIEVNSDTVQILTSKNLSKFNGNVVGEIKRNRVYEQNVSFAADKMQLDMLAHKADLHDNVSFKKRAVRAKARRGEIFLENYNKKLKYFVLFDDVRVVEKVRIKRNARKGTTFERKAFSEKLEGVMSEGKIILSGYPKVIQQGDIIKGNLIILREDVDVIEVVDANTNFKVGN